MDKLLDSHFCLLSYENYEHAYFLYSRTMPFVMKAIMACRPKHPSFGMIVNALPAHGHIRIFFFATGPMFLTKLFPNYNKTSKRDSVSLLHPKYLLPTFDKRRIHKFKRGCALSKNGQQKALCDRQIKELWRNKPHNISYTAHHWYHVVSKSRKWPGSKTFNVSLTMNKHVSSSHDSLQMFA